MNISRDGMMIELIAPTGCGYCHTLYFICYTQYKALWQEIFEDIIID